MCRYLKISIYICRYLFVFCVYSCYSFILSSIFMKYIYIFLLSFLLFGTTSAAYAPPSILTSFLDTKITAYETQIAIWWEERRDEILFKLQTLQAAAPSSNYRNIDQGTFIYIMDYLVQNIEKKPVPLLTREDFAATYIWFDIVAYPEKIIATVINEWSWGQTDDDSFQNLAGFIFGDNTSGAEIAMTSPVIRTWIDEYSYETAFIMPSGWTLESLPTPNNDRVTIKTIPASLKAVKKFSGRVSKDVADKQWSFFQEDMKSQWVTRYWRPTLSQYDGPRVSGNERRNELRVDLNAR